MMSTATTHVEDADPLCGFLEILSETVDDLDAIISSSSGVTDKRSTPSPRSRREGHTSAMAYWLGCGSHGRKAVEALSTREEDGADDCEELLLFMEEDEEINVLCASTRYGIIEEACRLLLSFVASFPAANLMTSRTMHSVERLASSQVTRELFIYPFRHLLPQGPQMVADHARRTLQQLSYQPDITLSALPDDTRMPARQQLMAGVEASVAQVVDAIVAEFIFAPSKILQKSFSLFQISLEALLLHLTLSLKSVCLTHVMDTTHELGEPLITEAASLLHFCKVRTVLIFHSANAGEAHWIYLRSMLSSLQDKEHQASHPLYSTVWSEVLLALLEWTKAPDVASDETASYRMLAQLVSGVPTSLKSAALRSDNLRALVTSAEHLCVEPHLLSMTVPEWSHELSRAVGAPSAHFLVAETSTTKSPLISRMVRLWDKLLERSSAERCPPSWPEWMSSDAELHVLPLLHLSSWCTRQGLGSPEFQMLLPERGRVLADVICELARLASAAISSAGVESEEASAARSFLTSHHFAEYRQRRFSTMLAVVANSVAAQLAEPLQSSFCCSVVQLVLADASAQSSINAFQRSDFEFVRLLLFEVFPLTWNFSSVNRLKDFLATVQSDFTRESNTALPCISLVILNGIVVVVCEALVRLRSVWHIEKETCSLVDVLCASSDDTALFAAYLEIFADVVFVSVADKDPVAPVMSASSQKTQVPELCELPVAWTPSSPHDWLSSVPVPKIDSVLRSEAMWDNFTSIPVNANALGDSAASARDEGADDFQTAAAGVANTPQQFAYALIPLATSFAAALSTELLPSISFEQCTATVLDSDAKMHAILGRFIGEVLRRCVCTPRWTNGLLLSATHLVSCLRDNSRTDSQNTNPHDAKAEGNETSVRPPRILLHDVARWAILERIAALDGSCALTTVSPDVLRTAFRSAGDATDSERTAYVSQSLQTWRQFLSWLFS